MKGELCKACQWWQAAYTGGPTRCRNEWSGAFFQITRSDYGCNQGEKYVEPSKPRPDTAAALGRARAAGVVR